MPICVLVILRIITKLRSGVPGLPVKVCRHNLVASNARTLYQFWMIKSFCHPALKQLNFFVNMFHFYPLKSLAFYPASADVLATGADPGIDTFYPSIAVKPDGRLTCHPVNSGTSKSDIYGILIAFRHVSLIVHSPTSKTAGLDTSYRLPSITGLPLTNLSGI